MIKTKKTGERFIKIAVGYEGRWILVSCYDRLDDRTYNQVLEDSVTKPLGKDLMRGVYETRVWWENDKLMYDQDYGIKQGF